MKTYEIKQVHGSTWYIDSPVIIPFYRLDESRCILLDTGTWHFREAMENTFEKYSMVPVGILGTHTHYDHYGNAAYFKEKYGSITALPIGEAEMSRSIYGVKSYLFCFSVGQVIKDKKMQAIPCETDIIIREDQEEVSLCGSVFKVIHTPGHSIDHISVITPDGVCYAGDALMCGHSLHASKLPYAFHMEMSLMSLEKMRSIKSAYMILAHRGILKAPYDDIIDENIHVMNREIEHAADIINRQMTVEEIYAAIQKEMGLSTDTVEKALDLERFLRPYLEHLIDRGSHVQTVKNGILCYGPA